jgi:hypothetical protein
VTLLAYVEHQSGVMEMFVTRFPSREGRRHVSNRVDARLSRRPAASSSLNAGSNDGPKTMMVAPRGDRRDASGWLAHLLTLSRRDRLVDHLANNIVPLAQDDDLVSLGPELRQYSVVTEIQNTAWKLALSRAMIKT